MSARAPRRLHRLPPKLRAAAPWLVAGAVLFWVSRSAQWSQVWAACRDVNPVAFGLAAIAFILVNCAADTFAMFHTFKWFGCRVPFRELYTIRAATYLLAVVQYYVGQAAIAGFLRRRRAIPLWQSAGWIVFISGINMLLLIALSVIGLVRADLAIPWLRIVPALVVVGAIGYGLLLHLRPAWLASLSLLSPMFEMGIRGHLKAMLVRLPHVLVLITWHFLALRWFSVTVPPLVALVYLPVVFFVAALPVSVQGLGLAQWAAVTFFAAYAPHGASSVLAYSLASTGVTVITQVLMGLLFLGPAQSLGLHPETEAAQSQNAASFERDIEAPSVVVGGELSQTPSSSSA